MGGSAQALWMLDSPVSGASFQGVAPHSQSYSQALPHWTVLWFLIEITQDVVLLGEMSDNPRCRVSDLFLYLNRVSGFHSPPTISFYSSPEMKCKRSNRPGSFPLLPGLFLCNFPFPTDSLVKRPALTAVPADPYPAFWLDYFFCNASAFAVFCLHFFFCLIRFLHNSMILFRSCIL